VLRKPFDQFLAGVSAGSKNRDFDFFHGFFDFISDLDPTTPFGRLIQRESAFSVCFEPSFASNIRVFTGASSDKIGAKIRLAQLEKVSYMLVLGAREKRGGEVAVQRRKSSDEGSVSASRFVDPNGSERT
jgi:hypothetical protein